MDTRREFLKKGALAGLGMMFLPEFACSKDSIEETVSSSELRNLIKDSVLESNGVNAPKLTLKKDCVILFQGDSITDAGRKREANICNSSDMLGPGYALFAATALLKKYADKKLKIYNRGVSGNKVYQLRERWEIDTLSFMPDVLSLLIGVNDYWHTLTGGYKGTVETYENDYRDLLKYTKEKLPNTQLVICEPFALKGGAAIDEPRWFPMFDEYRKVAKKLADEFGTIFVPYQSAFDAAMKLAPARYWSNDGVHPDLPGRQLMADVWLEATGL